MIVLNVNVLCPYLYCCSTDVSAVEKAVEFKKGLDDGTLLSFHNSESGVVITCAEHPSFYLSWKDLEGMLRC